MKRTLLLLLLISSFICSAENDDDLTLEIRGGGAKQGEPVLLVIKIARPAVWATADWRGQKLRFDPHSDKLIALAAIDRNLKPGNYPLVLKVMFEDGKEESFSRTLKVTGKTFEAQKLRVDPKYVKLSKKDLAWAREDNLAAGKAYASSGPQRLWEQGFIKPAEARWSGEFGVRRMFNGQERSYHSGSDIAVPKGTPIKASNNGRVALVKNMFFGGKTVLIDHGQGVFTGYMHLSTFNVTEGQLVDQGEVIGHSGKTGRVTGAHLHWMLRIHNIKVNPKGLLQMKLD